MKGGAISLTQLCKTSKQCNVIQMAGPPQLSTHLSIFNRFVGKHPAVNEPKFNG